MVCLEEDFEFEILNCLGNRLPKMGASYFFVILEYVIEMKNEMKLTVAILRICAN